MLCFRQTIKNFEENEKSDESIYSILNLLIKVDYTFYQTFEKVLTDSQIASLSHEHSQKFVEKLFFVLRRLCGLITG